MRLGAIAYCNPRPVDGWLLSQKEPSDLTIVSEVPAVLNQMMLASQLDVSAVSFMHYAEHAEHYYLIPEVLIAAESAVQSVLLIHDKPLESIKTIEFSGEGRTTPGLCEMLFAMSRLNKPLFLSGPDIRNKPDAKLIIGDEALRFFAAHHSDSSVYITDLAEYWHRLTGKSAVFAVWAVRKVFAEQQPSKLAALQDLLYNSRQWGSLNLQRIIHESAESLNMPIPIMEEYFTNLRYDFSEDLLESAKYFALTAQKFGLLKKLPDFHFMKTRFGITGDVK
ncbi:MAG: menaquinone biosynthesis protein [Candidatus Omnitrophica bacterium]|nr:menaquinone biosynthesis protein [Candidatus Omnitrophota bacterium]